jgi:hypothetical protein
MQRVLGLQLQAGETVEEACSGLTEELAGTDRTPALI